MNNCYFHRRISTSWFF